MALPSSHLHILLALTRGPQHGYAVMSATRESGTALGPGALYAALGRLTDTGLIEELEERPAPDLDDARRRYYRITDLGEAALATELDRLADLVHRAVTTTSWRPRPGAWPGTGPGTVLGGA